MTTAILAILGLTVTLHAAVLRLVWDLRSSVVSRKECDLRRSQCRKVILGP